MQIVIKERDFPIDMFKMKKNKERMLGHVSKVKSDINLIAIKV